MPPGRKRWQQLKRIIDGLRWTRVEALNSRGQVLDVVECELEDDDEELIAEDVRFYQQVRLQVKIALEAQDKAVQRNTEHMREALDSCVKVNRALADQLASTMRMYDAKLKLLDKFHDGEEEEGGLMSSKFIESIPALIQLANAQKANGGAS